MFPGVNDDGTGTNSPQIGLLVDAGSQGVVSGSYFHAATTAITDNAGLNYDNSVITAIGATASPTITVSPNVAAYQGKSLTLSPPAAPANDPLEIVNQNSGERAFGMKVSGDSSDRVKWTSDGTLNLGPGNTTQDTTIKRQSAGVLGTSNTHLAVSTAGYGLRVKEGTNAKQGTATLSAGTVTVANTSVTASSRIILTAQDNNTTGSLRVSARTAETSFVITSSNAADTGVVAYQIFEPA